MGVTVYMGMTRTAILLAALTGLFLAAGFLLGGEGGMMIALVVAVAMNLFAYWNSDKVVLRMYNAQPVDGRTAPELYDIVARLAERAGLPMPAVYIVDTPQPNAFATGRDPQHAAVAVTTGILKALSREELAGVLAHELAHVKNRDTLIMTVTATLAGALSMLANFAFFLGGGNNRNNPLGAIGTILIMILAPLGAALVQMAISRTREYDADRLGAEICGRPLWLASALERIEAIARGVPNPAAEHNPASAHMFIINPLSGRGADNLFATHPSTANRVRKLRELAGAIGAPEPRAVQRPTRASGPWG